jgi:hypothetical protein
MSLGRHSGEAGENLSLQRSSRQAETLNAIVLSLADLDAVQLCLQPAGIAGISLIQETPSVCRDCVVGDAGIEPATPPV